MSNFAPPPKLSAVTGRDALRSPHIKVRLEPKEQMRWRDFANDYGMKLGDFIRYAVNEYMRCALEQEKLDE